MLDEASSESVAASSGTAQGHVRPYIGLRPYTQSESELFFGRERDADLLVNKILSNRLTLLYAPSGVGKTSLLRTLVIPALVEAGLHDSHVVYFDHWVEADPYALLVAAIAPDSCEPSQDETREYKLKDWLTDLGRRTGKAVVLILDQFEEFLQRNEGNVEPFRSELARVVRSNANVQVVISFREEFLAAVDSCFRDHLVGLFASTFHLEHLGPQQAKEAIEKPAHAFGKHYDPALINRLLVELDSRPEPNAVAVAGGRGGPSEPGGLGAVSPSLFRGGIELPFLQIICSRLWRATEAGLPLSVETYDQLGGKDAIIREYVQEVMSGLSDRRTLDAARLFALLVPRTGLKVAYPLDVLAEQARVPSERALAVLNHLEKNKIIRTRERRDGVTYELFHDAFIGILGPWRAERLGQHRRRIIIGAGAVIACVAFAMGGVATWALIQQKDAQASRDGAIEAMRVLSADPVNALKLATKAYETKATDEALEVLRMAYEQVNCTALLRVQGNVSVLGALLSPDDRYLLARTSLGLPILWRLNDSAGHQALELAGPARPAIGNGRAPGVTAAAFAPDGSTLFTGYEDGSIYEWSLATGASGRLAQMHRVVEGSSGLPAEAELSSRGDSQRPPIQVKLLRISPNGRWLAAVLWDGRTTYALRVISLADRKPRVGAEVFKDELVKAAFGPSGTLALAFSWGIRVLDLESGKSNRIPLPDDFVVDLAFSADGRRLAAVGVGYLWLIDPSRPGKDAVVAQAQKSAAKGTGFESVAIGADETRIVTTSTDGGLLSWRYVNRQLQSDVALHDVLLRKRARALRVLFDPGGKLVAAIGPDRVVRILDVETHLVVAEYRGHEGAITELSFGRNLPLIATASEDGTARVWSLSAAPRELGFTKLQHEAELVMLHGESRKIFIRDKAGSFIRMARLDDGETDEQFFRSDMSIDDMSVNADGSKILGIGHKYLEGGPKEQLVMWKVSQGPGPVERRGEEPKMLREERSRPRQIELLPGTGNSQSADDKTRPPAPIRAARFTNDQADGLLTVHTDGAVMLWALSDDSARRVSSGSLPARPAGVIPDAATHAGIAVVASPDGNAYLFRTSALDQMPLALKHGGGLRTVAIALDGRQVLTGGGHDAVLWDTTTGAEIVRRTHPRNVERVAFGAGGTQLTLTEPLEGAIRVWFGDSETPRGTIRPKQTIKEVSSVQYDDAVWIVGVTAEGIMRYPCPVYCWAGDELANLARRALVDVLGVSP